MPENDGSVTFVSADDSLAEVDGVEVEQTDEYNENDVAGTEDVDVDFSADADDEVEETSDTAEDGDKPAKEKKVKEKARGDLPEGYVTPVGLAHALNEAKLGKFDEDGNHVDIPPQVVYSYIKNAPKDHPFPIETVKDSIGKERQALKLEAGLQWWREKNERAAARKANAAEKAKAKLEKAAKTASESPSADAASEPVADEAE